MRLSLLVVALVAAAGAGADANANANANANATEPANANATEPANANANANANATTTKKLPPRWRVRAQVSSGFGGSWDHGAVAAFPTTIDLGVRIWGPLSASVGATGVLSGDTYTACGSVRRANAVIGHAGLRVDFNNRRGDSWLDPFVEVHAGVGTEGVGRESYSVCRAGGVFASGGARAGLDVWMGRAAITIAVAFDYTPVATPAAGFLGATFILK